MADDVEPFPKGLTRPDAEALIHELAKESRNLAMEAPHFRERMRERGITMRQVLETLPEGRVDSEPTKDQYGDWRCVVKKRCAGRRVRVVVAIHDRSLLYGVTTY